MVGTTLEKVCQGLRYLVGFLMISLAIPVGMQVLSRHTGIIPVFLWTEELATFIFVWTVMLGSMIAVWEGTHFDVRVFADAKAPRWRLLQNGIVLIAVIIFALLFAWYGIEYAKFGYIQNSVMMRANLAIIYVSVPVAGLLWTLFASYRLYETIALYRAEKDTVL